MDKDENGREAAIAQKIYDALLRETLWDAEKAVATVKAEITRQIYDHAAKLKKDASRSSFCAPQKTPE
jgi:hypothetical protein